MSKLRSAEEVWDEYWHCSGKTVESARGAIVRIIEARDDAVRQACCHNAVNSAVDGVYTYSGIKNACLAAGKADDKRERLAGLIFDSAWLGGCPFTEQPEQLKKKFRRAADAVLDELEKMNSEAPDVSV